MECNRQEEFILNISLLEYADLVKQYILNVEIKEISHLMHFMYQMSSDCSAYMDENFNEEILELEKKINYKQTKTQIFNKKSRKQFLWMNLKWKCAFVLVPKLHQLSLCLVVICISQDLSNMVQVPWESRVTWKLKLGITKRFFPVLHGNHYSEAKLNVSEAKCHLRRR